MKLSQRLLTAAGFVPPGGVLADIGADRGELSYYLLDNSMVERVILSDISAKSLNRARELFNATPLADKAEFRVGDGLAILNPQEADAIVLAGMGGQTIVNILSAQPQVSRGAKALVVQAMGNTPQVRRWFQDNGFTITAESIIWEDGHYYTIIRGEPGPSQLTDLQLYAGPLLLKRGEPLLKESLCQERAVKAHILQVLTNKSQGQERQEKLQQELRFLDSLLALLEKG